MWWVGTVTNIPNYTAINYKIGVWNSANNEEKFADYNAGTPNTVFNFSIGATTGTNGVPVLTVDGMNADYTTEHLFVDEVAGDSIPVTILFSPNTNNVVEADVFSDLNRRSFVTTPTLDANGDPTEEGIVPAGRQHHRHGRRHPLLQGLRDDLHWRRPVFADAQRDELRRVSPDRALQGFGQHQLVLVWRCARPLHRRDADPGAQHDDV